MTEKRIVMVERFVWVRRQPSGTAARYPLDTLDRPHWSTVSGGRQQRAAGAFIHGYVDCDGALEGEVGHSGSHGPCPHRIKVCVVARDNDAEVMRHLKSTAGPKAACRERDRPGRQGDPRRGRGRHHHDRVAHQGRAQQAARARNARPTGTTRQGDPDHGASPGPARPRLRAGRLAAHVTPRPQSAQMASIEDYERQLARAGRNHDPRLLFEWWWSCKLDFEQKRALMPSTSEGRVAFILADLREPEAILGDPAVARTLDLAQPVGLVLIGIMHHLRDEDDPRGIIATLVDALAPGSYLVLSQTTPAFN